MKKIKFIFFLIFLGSLFVDSTALAYKWDKVDWGSISSSISYLELEAIENDKVCKVDENTFYRVVQYVDQGKSDVEKTIDKGNTWDTVYSRTNRPGYTPITQVDAIGTEIYVSLHFFSIYTFNNNGYIYKTDDGGQTWQNIITVSGYSCTYFMGVVSLKNTLYGAYRQGVYNLTDKEYLGFTNGNCVGRIESTDSAMYVRAWGDIFESKDGVKWNKVWRSESDNGPAEDIWVHESELYCLSEAGEVYLFTPSPEASFKGSPLNGFSPLTVSFTDFSKGEITDWYWDFGDGQTNTDQNTLHTYTKTGPYNVSLSVNGPAGSDTKTINSYIFVRSKNMPWIPLLLDETLEVQITWYKDSDGDGYSDGISQVAIERP